MYYYYVYNVTFDFLKHLGLSKLEDLPNFAELNKQTDESLADLEKVDLKETDVSI